MSFAQEEPTIQVTYSTLVGGRAYHKKLLFASDAAYTEWKTKAEGIKKIIARITLDYESDRCTMESLNDRLGSWVRLVDDFAATYGNHKVPLDIRNAMHDSQRNLDLTLMDFGPDTGGYFKPGLKFKK